MVVTCIRSETRVLGVLVDRAIILDTELWTVGGCIQTPTVMNEGGIVTQVLSKANGVFHLFFRH